MSAPRRRAPSPPPDWQHWPQAVPTVPLASPPSPRLPPWVGVVMSVVGGLFTIAMAVGGVVLSIGKADEKLAAVTRDVAALQAQIQSVYDRGTGNVAEIGSLKAIAEGLRRELEATEQRSRARNEQANSEIRREVEAVERRSAERLAAIIEALRELRARLPGRTSEDSFSTWDGGPLIPAPAVIRQRANDFLDLGLPP